jgi:hypothetical protein
MARVATARVQLNVAVISGGRDAESERSVQNGLAHLPVPTLIARKGEACRQDQRVYGCMESFPASRRGSDRKAATAFGRAAFFIHE